MADPGPFLQAGPASKYLQGARPRSCKRNLWESGRRCVLATPAEQMQRLLDEVLGRARQMLSSDLGIIIVHITLLTRIIQIPTGECWPS